VFMVSTSDGWAVGSHGVILRWVGSGSGAGFPAGILPLLLIAATVVAVAVLAGVVLKRRASKRRRSALASTDKTGP
jgi:hypothetical protein